MNEQHIFISHSWAYDKSYTGLISLLEGRGYFKFKDYSVPKDDPIHIKSGADYEKVLKERIKDQMRSCQAVLIIAGVYATYSDSIKLEIEAAQELGKPIIAIRPFGASRISSLAEQAADMVVGWNADSIVAALREYC